MFHEKPEISETLEWMLQSSQVGEEILVQSLVREHYKAICLFAFQLLDTLETGIASSLADKTIIKAVKKTQDYRGEIQVRAWLFRIAVKLAGLSASASMHSGCSIESVPVSGDELSLLKEAITSLDKGSRLTYLLREYHHFSVDEIAAILDQPVSEVESYLGVAKLDMQAFYTKRHIPPIDRGELTQALSTIWSIPDLSTKAADEIARKLCLILQDKKRRKHRASVFGEIALIAIAIFIVTGLGLAVTVLSPELAPARVVYQTQLVSKIVYLTPTPAPTLPPTPFPEKAILYEAARGETLSDIAEWTFLNVEILSALNNIPPDYPLEHGQKVMIGVRDPPQLMPTRPGEILVTKTPIPELEPLTLSSTDEEIRQRIFASRRYWHTLWADALLIQYGPPGYVGEPDVRRQQIWINQPYISYLLDGEMEEVEYISVSTGGLINFINLKTGEKKTNRESELVNYSNNIQQLLMPSELRENFRGELVLLELAEMAGRRVLVFDWFVDGGDILTDGSISTARRHQGRYWVDTYYGIILRRQRFNSNDLSQMLNETVIADIEFNFDIPHRLFNRSQPSQTYFARDLHGNPASRDEALPIDLWSPQPKRTPLPRQFPAEDFDPAGSRLSFQWTNISAFNPGQVTSVDLFADGYYLDNIEFVDPYQILCTRSPNGNLIAFTGWSAESLYVYVPVRWFSLSDLPTVHQLLPEIVPYDLVFAPDNRQLAVYGCGRYEDPSCGIFIFDTVSGQVRKLTDVERGSGLTWSPDSNALAIQGSKLRQGKWRVLVFSVLTGNVIYGGPFDWEGFWVEPDSPLYSWGVELPPRGRGLDVCSEPPQADQ